ncbi:Orotate phosphoribosyltransferase [Pseudovibrio axinellae]|uniref:Orotate phosphoribosyltransferase n=1 Tax=Pseudovibrio axinellae TaxID=989403 RepID=A0A165WPN3_9HYPH|nr:orotate phosphoribosyltransferase [Pseudovibrio axinellae]KZL16767.1 Orotate phosphoribosyltransferase [Pseudovibrio axinellae]SEQ75488.1 orotate phosphoribosyltransferase [Pseudovibrio axinellae]
MGPNAVLDVFRETKALKEGHFILPSGWHSSAYLQRQKLLEYPEKIEILSSELVKKIAANELLNFTHFVAPSLGGLIVAHQTARIMQKSALWIRRESGNLTTGHASIPQKSNVFIIQDVVETTHLCLSTIQALQSLNINTVGIACFIDRSLRDTDLGVPLISLAPLKLPVYSADNVPKELAEIPAIQANPDHAI